MSEVIAVFIPIVALLSIVAIVKIIADFRLRRRLIEAGASEAMVHSLFSEEPKPHPDGALKWGLVMGGIGGAFVTLQSLGYDLDDPFSTGWVLLGAAAGLLLYYVIARRTQAAARRNADMHPGA